MKFPLHVPITIHSASLNIANSIFIPSSRFRKSITIQVYTTNRFSVFYETGDPNSDHLINFFYVLLTVNLSIIIVINQLDAQNLVL